MAHILFVTHDGLSHEPLGLEYLSACLKKAGHQTKACMQSRIMSVCKEWEPDWVAFQVLTGDQNKWGKSAMLIKDKFPNIKTIFGGPHFLFFSNTKQVGADVIVRGDGFKAIVDVVEGRKHTDFDAFYDLDSLPHLDRSLFYNEDFPDVKNNVIRNFIAYFGCPFSCSYCYNSNKKWQDMVKGHRLRRHSPEWIVEEVEQTIKDWGGDFVSFQDDILGVHMEWLEKFVRLYKKLHTPFFAQLRPPYITEDRIKLLKEAGVHVVSFAIESGNETTRREILNRRESNKLIEDGCLLLHKYDIRFRVQNLIGLPVENSFQDAVETLKFNIGVKPTLSTCSLLQVYPGTAIADYVIDRGIVKSQEELNVMADATFLDKPSLQVSGYKKIARLHKYWSAVVRWPWSYWFVRLLINFNFGNLWERWIFRKTRQLINEKEYWRVTKPFAKHIALRGKHES